MFFALWCIIQGFLLFILAKFFLLRDKKKPGGKMEGVAAKKNEREETERERESRNEIHYHKSCYFNFFFFLFGEETGEKKFEIKFGWFKFVNAWSPDEKLIRRKLWNFSFRVPTVMANWEPFYYNIIEILKTFILCFLLGEWGRV